ncbi:uncharacterized protein LOC134840419 [Symsagittifera roscoffensis]|uniref:uncharacterized protein LOC134840419 n=1 Tax=Symsagittifera roscoffensis TaxID=84072 RepID=UPI00307B4262
MKICRGVIRGHRLGSPASSPSYSSARASSSAFPTWLSVSVVLFVAVLLVPGGVEGVQCYKCSTQGSNSACIASYTSLGTESCDGFCYTYMTFVDGVAQGATRQCMTQQCVATSADGTKSGFTGVMVRCCENSALCNDFTSTASRRVSLSNSLLLLSSIFITYLSYFFI